MEKIKTTHWHCNTLFHFFPMFCLIFFLKNSHFFVRLFCPFYLNVQFFLRFFFVRLFCPFYLNVRFFLFDFFSLIFSDLFKCPIFLVRSILISDFFVWCFVRSSLMSDFSVQCFLSNFLSVLFECRIFPPIFLSNFLSDLF